MEPREKWLNTLNHLQIETSDAIKNADLIRRDMDDYECWIFEIVFDEVVPVNDLVNLFDDLKHAMIKTLGGVDCEFVVKYKSFDNIDKYLYEYLVYSLTYIGREKPDISIIEHYKWEISGGNISIIFPNMNELQISQKYLNPIITFFEKCGLVNVTISFLVEKSDFDIKKQHEAEIRNTENFNSSKTLEEYQQRVQEQKSNRVQDTYDFRKSNQAIDVNLDELPTTEYEIQEFGQINGTKKVSVHGVVVSSEIRSGMSKKNKPYNLFIAYVTDHRDTIQVKLFFNEDKKEMFEAVKPGLTCDLIGDLSWDNFGQDVVIMCSHFVTMGPDTSRMKYDGQLEKRVELHAHTKMTVLDSILNVEEYVEQAARFGHPALAVTDYENCHVLPTFFEHAKKFGIKPIAGIEVNFTDEAKLKIALTDADIPLKEATYTIFDIETTGFYIPFNEIIEIGAVKVKNGIIIDSFSQFVKPKKAIPPYIQNLTHISNEDVFDALPIDEVLPDFKKFIEGTILVAHNARFDTDFIYENMRRLNIFDGPYPCIDTLFLARCFSEKYKLKKFNLGSLGKALHVEVELQHRAIHDSRTLNNIFNKLLGDIYEEKIYNYKDLNNLVDPNVLFAHDIPHHLNILVKNRVGLKNMYQIVSDSQTKHFAKSPRVLKSVLDAHREGILIGSGDYTGDIFKTAMEKTPELLEKKMEYYDYIEVQPPSYYEFLFEKTKDLGHEEFIKDTIRLIINTAKKLGKIVVATGDVHELLSIDTEYRKIYLSVARPNGGGPHELNEYENIPDCHFRTTTEMLTEFNFLSSEEAMEIVVTNTNKINDMIEQFDLFPKELSVPRDDFLAESGVPSMKQAIYDLCDSNCHKLYGENIPKYVKERLDTELNAIIGHGYFSVYYISHLLVKDSNDNGYVVGSRGSVGSSFVATMMNITEVNPLLPHYLCPKCHFSAFKFTDEQTIAYNQHNVPQYILDALKGVSCGYDLPKMRCPVCDTELKREGINIAFETFLGFTGEKCPDIDLNFSGEYQPKAHLFVQKMFGKDYAYRAGTVSTVKLKTAAGYIRGYFDKKGIKKRTSEIERIANFIQDSKRTTGQHPGGIVVVPNYMDIHDITPVQFPPLDAKDSVEDLNWRTTHFDYHTYEKNLLKLDILGHDDPTMMKKLITLVHNNQDIFNFDDVDGIPLIDDDVLSIFSSKEALHIDGDDLDQYSSGTIGVPEFGTNLTRRMLETIKPKSINDIIKVSGLSHGTDVWFGNAEALVLGTAEEVNNVKVDFDDVIACRDDIMIFLIRHGVDSSSSFKIMEDVRKGKGLKEEYVKLMSEKGIPDWFIWTCKKIKYLFPRAHATAYVIMALRIAWFKVHYPIYYYAAYFSVRCKEFDAEVFAAGRNAIRNRIMEIQNKIDNHGDVKNKEIDLLEELYIALEMVLRGFKFLQIDLNKSDAVNFVISEDKTALYLPFVTLDALGESVANSIIEERNKRPFSSKADLERRTKINKTQLLKLQTLGVLDGLEENDINTLF